MMNLRDEARDPREFILDSFEPAYTALRETEELRRRAERAREELADCRACPRDCGVDRLRGQVGICRTGRDAIVASAFAHFGEESCLSGRRGSGTIFFSYCNLHCVFCQNWELSQRSDGRACTPAQIAELMLHLQADGCHNINLVTPEHVVPQVVQAICLAVAAGLQLPVVYNTSAYDSVDSLRLLEGLIDIYMPDFKFWQAETARRLAKAEDYPEAARSALREMHRQVGDLKFDHKGVALRGVLVRHLVLPGLLDESSRIFRWLAEEISPHTFINVMAQYRPCFRVGRLLGDGTRRYADINRSLEAGELRQAKALAREAGLWRLDREV